MCKAVKMAQNLIRRFGTRDPFQIGKALNIRIGYADMGSVRGIFLQQYRLRQIRINTELDDNVKRQICAHELGHAVLHSGVNTYYMDHYTFCITDKIEVEANIFAAALLIKETAETLELTARINGLELPIVQCWGRKHLFYQ